MGKIAIIGAGDERSWAQQMMEALKSEHPDYEVVYIDSNTDLSHLNKGDTFDLVLCDEAQVDAINERNGFGKDAIAHLNRVNVGTIGHIDHRIQDGIHPTPRTVARLRALDRNPQGWLETCTKRGKGQRKANKASRWSGSPY